MKKRKIKFTDKKHSRNGILSTILGAVSAGLLFCLLAAAYLTSGQAERQWRSGTSGILCSMRGAWYGVLGRREEDSYRLFPGSWNRYQWTASGRICDDLYNGMVTSMEMNETLRERQQLAYERIRQIAADPEINGAVGDYFQKTGKFALLILKARELAEEDYFAKASVDELKAWNEKLYEDIAGNAY